MNIFEKLLGIFKKKEKPSEEDRCTFDLEEWVRVHEDDPHFDELCPTVFANAQLFSQRHRHMFNYLGDKEKKK